ncbi:MAG: YlxM family DNA-binding protein [Oscillospiraceae bacterium]
MPKNLEITTLYDFYGDLLTEKQQEVIELYYNEDLSLAEIAAHSGITRQGVRDSIKRAEFQLNELEQQLGLASRFRSIHTSLEDIVKNTAEIDRLNMRLYGSKEITDRVGRINELARRIAEQ